MNSSVLPRLGVEPLGADRRWLLAKPHRRHWHQYALSPDTTIGGTSLVPYLSSWADQLARLSANDSVCAAAPFLNWALLLPTALDFFCRHHRSLPAQHFLPGIANRLRTEDESRAAAWSYQVDTVYMAPCFDRYHSFQHAGSFPEILCQNEEARGSLAVLQLCQEPSARLANRTLRCLDKTNMWAYFQSGPKVRATSAVRTGCFRYEAPETEGSWECSFAAPKDIRWTPPPVDLVLDKPWLGHMESRQYRDLRPDTMRPPIMGSKPYSVRYPWVRQRFYENVSREKYYPVADVSILALRRQGRLGGKPYVHQYSLVVADMLAALAGWWYVVVEGLSDGVLARYSPRVCQSFLLSFVVSERATPVQVSLLANVIICIGISLDRHQSVTGLLAYQMVNQKRRAILMNLVAYLGSLLIIGPTYADNIVPIARIPAARVSGRLSNATDTGVCCQTLFVDRATGDVHVAWLDNTQWLQKSQEDSPCFYTTAVSGLRLEMAGMQMGVLALLVVANVRFALAYRKDRLRAAAQAQAQGGGRGPVSGRRLAAILGLSSVLHLATGLTTAAANVFPNRRDLLNHLAPTQITAVIEAAEVTAQVLTGFNLVSTFTFYLAISRTFRKSFLDVLLCKKD